MADESNIIDLWMNDADFRERFRKDPSGALSEAGFELSEEQATALATVEPGLTDEQLVERLSMSARGSFNSC